MISKSRLALSGLVLLLLGIGCESRAAPPTFVTTWGEQGAGPGQFNEPFDIAVGPEGFLYVTDARSRRVQKFTTDGAFVTQWSGKGKGKGLFEKPTGIDVSADGFVYVSDYDNDLIQKFTTDGAFVTQWGGSGEEEGFFDSPSGLSVDSEGNIYVMDLYNHRVQKFTEDGTFILAWGEKEKVNNIRSALNFLFNEGLPGMFYFPAKIAVHPDGEVYVSDSYNNRVQVFTKGGTFLRKWGGMGFWGGRFRVASDISFGRKGRVYVDRKSVV